MSLRMRASSAAIGISTSCQLPLALVVSGRCHAARIEKPRQHPKILTGSFMLSPLSRLLHLLI
jgi:hypothetical protein